MNISRLMISAISLTLLSGCPTAAQRQFQAMKTGTQAAVTRMDNCISTIYNSPEYSVIRSHVPLDPRDATLAQLSDNSLISQSEWKIMSENYTKIQQCRKNFLEDLSKSEPSLVPILAKSYNKATDDLLALSAHRLTWGEFVARNRDRATETQAAVQAEDRRVVAELRREHQSEVEQRQRAAEALATWAQTQEMINAANRPVFTNCTGFGNSVNCITR